MRQHIKKSWYRIDVLQTALVDLEKIELKEGETIEQEKNLVTAQIEALEKAKALKIETHFSVTSEKIDVKRFQMVKILNNDVEAKQIALLGKLKQDPTNQDALLICRKTEFKDEQMDQKLIY